MLDNNTLEANKELVRRYYQDCWNKGNLDALNEYIAKDCRTHDAVFPTLEPGIDSLRRHIGMCRTGFPDMRFEIDDMIGERDEVVAHWTVNGTHSGAFLGMAPTKRSARVSGTSIYRIKNQKIAEQHVDWNLLTLLEQLGLATAPKVGATAR